MSEKEELPPWERLKSLDIGELNDINHDVFEARFEDNQDAFTTLRRIFRDKYSYDIHANNPGPYAAVVVSVLSGPQVKNQATTGGRSPNNLDEFPNPFFKEREKANKKRAVVVKARIPEFDVDIDWPKSLKDHARIEAHSEFFQFREDPALENINVGSIIWVTFDNPKQKGPSLNGKPAGKIIGIHTVGVTADIRTRESPIDSMSPKCQAARNLAAPPGGIYVGHTDPDPNQEIGPIPIRKIKGSIKTGLFGNGTPQTKAHFEAALTHNEVPISPKHAIPGPAPDSRSAFIWVGTLKNNGYMDVLDRPIGLGRETIIYAPMTLDLNSPVEIKYYLHDKAGFGHAHLNGPNSTVATAIEAANYDNNDFKLKIAPIIKDLNKDARNYILVIPEMAYSRGFGTINQDTSRIKKMIEGKKPGTGNSSKETIRTKVGPDVRPLVKKYLTGLPVETTKSLLSVTPLREREFATFDGSFTGGKIGSFHQEVIDVFEEHVATIYDKIDYVSILADGLGSIALSSISVDVLSSGTHEQGRLSFINTFMGKNLRIDFVTDGDLDSSAFYGYFFGGQTPSLSFWNTFLKVRASNVAHGYTEFNYITEPNKKQNAFFNFIGKGKKFDDNKTSTSGIGKKKFTLTAQEAKSSSDPALPNSNVFINMHLSPKDTKTKKSKTGYAFTMVNKSETDNFVDYPKKSDSNTSIKPGLHAVPDHAYALASKASEGDLEKISKKQKDLEPKIKYFEEIIELSFKEGPIITEQTFPPGSDDGFGIAMPNILIETRGPMPICVEHPIYCDKDKNKLQSDGSSIFFKHYKDYLRDKKEYMELKILKTNEARIVDIINDKNALIKEKNSMQKKSLLSEAEANQKNSSGMTYLKIWEHMHVHTPSQVLYEILGSPYEGDESEAGQATSVDFYSIGQPDVGMIAEVAEIIVKKEAYKKLFNKLQGAIKNVNPLAVSKPAECAGQPEKLGDKTAPKGTVPLYGKSSKPGNNCSDIKIITPSNFKELSGMIPYYPEKTDFQFSGKESRTKTKIHTIEGFNLDTFNYDARGSGNTTDTSVSKTIKTSPPVWACIADDISFMWKEACVLSGYYPFEITTGIRGSSAPNKKGISAYTTGMSLHSYGLAIDVDPPIAGYSPDGKQILSVFTGAWTYKIMKNHAEELHELGVFSENAETLQKNALDGDRPRLVQDWKSAPGAYVKDRYDKIMKSSSGQPIVPLNSNPTLWVILFCQKSGMKWGNGMFLKKRFRGGKTWSKPEQKRISEIYGIDNIVEKVKNISWNTNLESHMHFQKWNGAGLVSWEDIKKVKKEMGK